MKPKCYWAQCSKDWKRIKFKRKQYLVWTLARLPPRFHSLPKKFHTAQSLEPHPVVSWRSKRTYHRRKSDKILNFREWNRTSRVEKHLKHCSRVHHRYRHILSNADANWATPVSLVTSPSLAAVLENQGDQHGDLSCHFPLTITVMWLSQRCRKLHLVSANLVANLSMYLKTISSKLLRTRENEKLNSDMNNIGPKYNVKQLASRKIRVKSTNSPLDRGSKRGWSHLRISTSMMRNGPHLVPQTTVNTSKHAVRRIWILTS